MNELEINSLLEKLGLTEYEAKTMTALFGLSESEAPEISRKAQVPKTRVYDVLERLTKRGLIIEIYGRPKKYRVVEAENVFNQLIEKRKAELKSLEEKAAEVKELIEASNGKDEAQEKVMKVKDKFDFMRILSQEIDKAQENVVAFTGIGKEYDLLKESLKCASKNKVKVKMISHVPKEVSHLIKEYESMGIDLKNLEHGMHAYVVDGKKVILALSDLNQEKPEYHFAIWNNNKVMANVLTNYFNNCWERAQKPK